MDQTKSGIFASLLMQEWGKKIESMVRLPQSGSYREYYRIFTDGRTLIGAYNHDIKENRAYFSFTQAFLKNNIRVPEIYAISKDQQYYLLEDAGEQTLFAYLQSQPGNGPIKDIYKKIIPELLKIQFNTTNSIDYGHCYPRECYDAQSVMWDLNYFKYNFVKCLQVPFDEQKLENDFVTLTQAITSFPTDAFLYRDFQSSNIMLKGDELYFIDFQGGRKGPFYYDLASLLFDAKANLYNALRESLMDHYFEELQKYREIPKTEFKNHFTLFVLIRMMQAMGAYGFRGLYENKGQFIKSIPLAIANLGYVIQNYPISIDLPELKNVLMYIAHHPGFQPPAPSPGKLKVRINSFSFRKGIPRDLTGNGGGFVFDCRGLPNPGRLPEYKHVDGRDVEVIDFFRDKTEVHDFMGHVSQTVEIAVKDYVARKRKHLMVNFGCTGGQHRSVYCAEKLHEYLKQFDLVTELKHLEQDGGFY
jgi:aminoglycoside/choline kinase family phosphotransferase